MKERSNLGEQTKRRGGSSWAEMKIRGGPMCKCGSSEWGTKSLAAKLDPFGPGNTSSSPISSSTTGRRHGQPVWWCTSATHPSIHHRRPSPAAPISRAVPACLHLLLILLAAPYAYLAVVLLPDVLPAALLLLLCFPSPHVPAAALLLSQCYCCYCALLLPLANLLLLLL